jgi:hypothetical protein
VLVLQATGNQAWLPDSAGLGCLVVSVTCLAHAPRVLRRCRARPDCHGRAASASAAGMREAGPFSAGAGRGQVTLLGEADRDVNDHVFLAVASCTPAAISLISSTREKP